MSTISWVRNALFNSLKINVSFVYLYDQKERMAPSWKNDEKTATCFDDGLSKALPI